MARGIQLIKPQSELEAVLKRIEKEGFYPVEVFTLDVNRRGVGGAPPEKLPAKVAQEYHEVRFGHKDGNVGRLFPNATDGNVHFYEYL